jgi:hypothetical protein
LPRKGAELAATAADGNGFKMRKTAVLPLEGQTAAFDVERKSTR